MSYKNEVIVRHQFKGMHNWGNCHIGDVAFLKHPHRHIFHVELVASVNHADRDIEFFMLQRLIDSSIYNLYHGESDMGYIELGSRSCEMIAKDIIDILVTRYDLPSTEVTCSVFEDNENGAKVSWVKG